MNSLFKISFLHTVFSAAAIISLSLILMPTAPLAASTIKINSIDDIKETEKIRQGVRDSVSTVRNKKNPSLMPDLVFYEYTLKKGDTFWKILAKTTLNIDTVMSVNNISSPYSIKEGDTVYLTNMRGVIHKRENDSIQTIEKKYGIKQDYIFKANKISSLSKPYLFIPCGEVPSLERSLFLGTGFAAPLEKLRRTSGFGVRKDPFTGEKAFHTGIDLGCKVNTPVYAARAGKVVYTGYKGDYGRLVIIEHPCGYFSYYGHLSAIKTRIGKTVSANDVIALSGNTGRTTGPHLHFEIRKQSKPVNPVIILR